MTVTTTHALDRLTNLVPQPRSVEERDGIVTIPARLTAAGPGEWVGVVAEVLEPGTGVRVSPVEGEAFLTVAQRDGKAGSYVLDVTAERISIAASDVEGVVAAVATLRQLMPEWVFGPAPLPGAALDVACVRVEDEPLYSWRGMHLDVARHFAPLPFLYRWVDLLAAHKMNRFHLHLNDDQGWRFEVRKYPKLTTVGAVRSETVFPHIEQGDATPHGGAYTQDQLRALNAYAKRRGITIVPEIDVPGHVRALLAAYPEYGAIGHDLAVATGFGILEEVLHLTDETVAMVEDIFAELLEVFDSPWIHIGGDECPTNQWENDEDAARLAAERGLVGVAGLQPWFTERLRDWLAQRGREVIGWDEVIDQGELPGVMVMSWRGVEPGRRALAAGRQVVMSPYEPYYFDYYQSDSPDEPFAQPRIFTWQAVASFDPAEGVAEEHLPNLLGVQGQVWTEFIDSPSHVEYVTFPRAIALAEAGWRGPVDPDVLEPRLRFHLRRLDAAGVNYRPLDGPHPWQVAGGRKRRPEGHGQG